MSFLVLFPSKYFSHSSGQGMMCTKEDEKRLKGIQKMQIEERKRIEREEKEIDMMWHQVLLEECHRKVRIYFSLAYWCPLRAKTSLKEYQPEL